MLMLLPLAGGMLAEPIALFGSAAQHSKLSRQADHYVARATTMMNRARVIVMADRVDALPLLIARRNSLGAHFQRYQRLKHVSIFDPIVEHAPTSSKIVARTMKLDCMELGEVFAGYHARWLGVRPSEWLNYRTDMLATVDILTKHLEAELRAIRQLLLIANFYMPGPPKSERSRIGVAAPIIQAAGLI